MIVIKFLYLGKCVGMLSWLGTLSGRGEELGGVYPPTDVDARGVRQMDTVIVHNGEEEVKVYSKFAHWGDIISNAPEIRYPCGHYEIWSGDTQEAEDKKCILCEWVGNTACPECGTALEKSPYPQDHGALVCPLGGH